MSQEDIERLILEAEQFAAEDEVQRKRTGSLNSLSSFVSDLKTQANDQQGLGGKVSNNDKKTLLSTVKDTQVWIDENGQSASLEDLEEKLAEIQSVVNPITAKLYSQPAQDPTEHTEL